MKNFLSVLLLLSIFLISSSNTELKQGFYENGNIKYQINFNKGIFNGEFVSFYKNGKIKISGNFNRNQKIGEWRFNDSLGKVLAIKKYANSHQFEFVKINDKNLNEDISVLLKYSDEDLKAFNHFEVEKQNIIIAKRIWRNIFPSKINNIFFSNGALKKEILTQLKANKLEALSDHDAELMKLYADKLSNYKITHYKIVEDWYYDKQTHLLEVQIIGVCPVGAPKDEKNYKELFWFYYPGFINNIEKNTGFTINQSNEFEKKFYLRNFNSVIYKNENIYDKELAELIDRDDYKEKLFESEVKIMELEHEALLNFISK